MYKADTPVAAAKKVAAKSFAKSGKKKIKVVLTESKTKKVYSYVARKKKHKLEKNKYRIIIKSDKKRRKIRGGIGDEELDDMLDKYRTIHMYVLNQLFHNNLNPGFKNLDAEYVETLRRLDTILLLSSAKTLKSKQPLNVFPASMLILF
jgi:hypothetical protein